MNLLRCKRYLSGSNHKILSIFIIFLFFYILFFDIFHSLSLSKKKPVKIDIALQIIPSVLFKLYSVTSFDGKFIN